MGEARVNLWDAYSKVRRAGQHCKRQVINNCAHKNLPGALRALPVLQIRLDGELSALDRSAE